MVLYNFQLDLDSKYVSSIKDCLKHGVVLIVLHILMHFSKYKSFGISGSLFNEQFANTLVLVLLSFATYHLVFTEIINIE